MLMILGRDEIGIADFLTPVGLGRTKSLIMHISCIYQPSNNIATPRGIIIPSPTLNAILSIYLPALCDHVTNYLATFVAKSQAV